MALIKTRNGGGKTVPPEVQEYAPMDKRPIESVIGDAIEKTCDDAADSIIAKGDEVLALAQSFHAETLALADNVRKCGQLQKQRSMQIISMVADAGRTVNAVSTTFKDAAALLGDGISRAPDVTAGMEMELLGEQSVEK